MNKITRLFSLEGKIALVTGGYRGLGLGISRGLAEAGATVVISGRSQEGVDESVEKLRGEGLKAHGIVFDIGDEQAVDQAVSRLEQEVGPVDILVNNAGIMRRSPLLDMSLEDFEVVLKTDLTAVFIVSKRIAKGMIDRGGGKIINICSLMSSLARATTGNYAAAKGGLAMLTRAMTAEWASKNIHINGIAPGYFATEMTRPLKENPDFDRWLTSRTPSARWGDPDELQGLAIFLASPASDYINGQIIYIDGGLTAIL